MLQDAKDNLRTDLYFENQTQIKQLLYEEKAYPFRKLFIFPSSGYYCVNIAS